MAGDTGGRLVVESLRLESLLGVPPLLRVGAGKRPIGDDWPNGPRHDPMVWRERLRGWTGNVGALTGHGVVVVDLDEYKPEGAETARVLDDLGWLPADTVSAQTGSGGRHVWLRYDPARWRIGNGDFGHVTLPDNGRLPGGAEWKGDGGQVVVPPSTGASGNPYLWLEGCAPGDVEVAEAHPALLALIAGTSTGGPWGAYDPSDFDPVTVEAVTLLVERFGGHDPRRQTTGDVRYVAVTRPGKRGAEGSSASVGYVGPGVVKVWSSSWPPFAAGQVLDLGQLRRLAGVDGPRIHVPRVDVALVRSSAVRSAETRWLWNGALPAGQLTIAAGREKLGKSTAMVWVAARLTRGELPGDYASTPLLVGYVSAEDDAEHVLKPRAEAAGADHDRLYFLPQTGPAFTLDVVATLGLDVLILDPLSAFLVLGGRDEHGEVAVRQALEPFVRLAASGVTIVGVRHLRKSAPGDNPFDAVLGSRAWSAAARSVLFFTPDREHEDRPGGLIFPRGNLAPPGSTARYRLDSATVDLDDGNVGDVPRFVLDDAPVGITLDEALGPREHTSARLEAEEFLRDTLAAGPVKADEVHRLAEDAGIAERTLKRAKKDLGVVSDRVGFGAGSEVLWRLP